jgi:hypothetical protein
MGVKLPAKLAVTEKEKRIIAAAPSFNDQQG